jgi:P27 family predicted phage terminase small subunit
MGTRGPAPMPTVLRAYEGNPSRRPFNHSEPRPRPKTPKCPDHLDEEAKKQWRKLVPILKSMRVLTEADGIQLSNLCVIFSTLVKAQTKLNGSGLIYKTGDLFRTNPLLRVINDCVDRINILCREFGLTPASRTRIHAENPDYYDRDDLLD